MKFKFLRMKNAAVLLCAVGLMGGAFAQTRTLVTPADSVSAGGRTLGALDGVCTATNRLCYNAASPPPATTPTAGDPNSPTGKSGAFSIYSDGYSLGINPNDMYGSAGVVLQAFGTVSYGNRFSGVYYYGGNTSLDHDKPIGMYSANNVPILGFQSY